MSIKALLEKRILLQQQYKNAQEVAQQYERGLCQINNQLTELMALQTATAEITTPENLQNIQSFLKNMFDISFSSFSPHEITIMSSKLWQETTTNNKLLYQTALKELKNNPSENKHDFDIFAYRFNARLYFFVGAGTTVYARIHNRDFGPHNTHEEKKNLYTVQEIEQELALCREID